MEIIFSEVTLIICISFCEMVVCFVYNNMAILNSKLNASEFHRNASLSLGPGWLID